MSTCGLHEPIQKKQIHTLQVKMERKQSHWGGCSKILSCRIEKTRKLKKKKIKSTNRVLLWILLAPKEGQLGISIQFNFIISSRLENSNYLDKKKTSIQILIFLVFSLNFKTLNKHHRPFSHLPSPITHFPCQGGPGPDQNTTNTENPSPISKTDEYDD